jgi:hypothetical protein
MSQSFRGHRVGAFQVHSLHLIAEQVLRALALYKVGVSLSYVVI